MEGAGDASFGKLNGRVTLYGRAVAPTHTRSSNEHSLTGVCELCKERISRNGSQSFGGVLVRSGAGLVEAAAQTAQTKHAHALEGNVPSICAITSRPAASIRERMPSSRPLVQLFR